MITKVFILVIILVLVGIFFSLRHIFQEAEKFYAMARALEVRIKNGDELSEIWPQFLEVSKKAFEHNTHARVRELGKMIEAKYGIGVFK